MVLQYKIKLLQGIVFLPEHIISMSQPVMVQISTYKSYVHWFRIFTHSASKHGYRWPRFSHRVRRASVRTFCLTIYPSRHKPVCKHSDSGQDSPTIRHHEIKHWDHRYGELWQVLLKVLDALLQIQ